MTSARYPRVGEVLDDRVENDGVEVALRQRLGDVGGLGQQLDPITPPICNCSSERARVSIATADMSVPT